jgi:hypothetical protein
MIRSPLQYRIFLIHAPWPDQWSAYKTSGQPKNFWTLHCLRAFLFSVRKTRGKNSKVVEKYTNSLLYSRKDLSFIAERFRRIKQNYFCLTGGFYTHYGTCITLKGHTLKLCAYSSSKTKRKYGQSLTDLPKRDEKEKRDPESTKTFIKMRFGLQV